MSKKLFQLYALLSLGVFFYSCSEGAQIESEFHTFDNLASLPDEIYYPISNPYSEVKEELGRLLFWDPILSGAKDISCATCHHPDHGYSDGLDRSIGVQGQGLGSRRDGTEIVDRNSQTIINSGYNGITLNGLYNPETAPMFWDLRALGLEEQAIEPILNATEMRGELFSEEEFMAEVISRLEDIPEYVRLFNAAFGREDITEVRIGQSIATFERGIVSNNSPFDQYLKGDENALNNREIQGLELFIQVGCAECHSGPMLSDFELHTLGVPNNGINDRGANENFDFRTPTLRNVELTAPYMHNGRFNTLRDVVEFYEDIADGDEDDINRNINFNDVAEEARDLDLNRRDVDDIVAFLRTLTDENFDRQIPQTVPSGLSVGGDIQ